MGRRPRSAAAPRRSPEDRVLDAALALAASGRWRGASMADIAAEAKVPLAELYDMLPAKAAAWPLLMRRTDRQVLTGTTAETAGEPTHDRLLDILMRRLEALAPHKEAIRGLIGAAPRDPLGLACAGAGLLRSMAWSLEAAGVSSAGISGAVRVKGLTAIYLSTLRVWLSDDSPDLGRTMAHLDRALRNAGRLCASLPRRRPSRTDEAEAPA